MCAQVYHQAQIIAEVFFFLKLNRIGKSFLSVVLARILFFQKFLYRSLRFGGNVLIHILSLFLCLFFLIMENAAVEDDNC